MHKKLILTYSTNKKISKLNFFTSTYIPVSCSIFSKNKFLRYHESKNSNF